CSIGTGVSVGISGAVAVCTLRSSCHWPSAANAEAIASARTSAPTQRGRRATLMNCASVGRGGRASGSRRGSSVTPPLCHPKLGARPPRQGGCGGRAGVARGRSDVARGEAHAVGGCVIRLPLARPLRLHPLKVAGHL